MFFETEIPSKQKIELEWKPQEFKLASIDKFTLVL